MKLFLWSGVLLFIGSFFFLLPNFEDLNVAQNGQVVNMRIEKLPAACSGTRIKHFMTVSYNYKYYTKRVGGSYCKEHYIGEVVRMKFLKGAELVLFPEESGIPNLVALIILGLFGLVLIIYWYAKR